MCVGLGRGGANSLSLFVCPRAELDKERLRSSGSLDLDGQPLQVRHFTSSPLRRRPRHFMHPALLINRPRLSSDVAFKKQPADTAAHFELTVHCLYRRSQFV